MLTAQDIISLLDLKPLPQEGGHFRETYRSLEQVPAQVLPARYQTAKAFGTAIYILFTPADFSAMHRLDTDEIFHFYYGDPLDMLLLRPDGSGELVTLGSDLAAGMRPQIVAPRGVWQGSRPVAEGRFGFSLIGTTMAPGFDWAGFELGDAAHLCDQYPIFAGPINARVHA